MIAKIEAIAGFLAIASLLHSLARLPLTPQRTSVDQG
jgi:hypothetical protein